MLCAVVILVVNLLGGVIVEITYISAAEINGNFAAFLTLGYNFLRTEFESKLADMVLG